MGPFCPPEQSPTDDTWRQLLTALLSSSFVAGENPVMKEEKEVSELRRVKKYNCGEGVQWNGVRALGGERRQEGLGGSA